MSKKKAKKERTSKYWICPDCANKKGWTCDGVVTCVIGLCGWCDNTNEVTLTPHVDFYKPDGSVPIFD